MLVLKLVYAMKRKFLKLSAKILVRRGMANFLVEDMTKSIRVLVILLLDIILIVAGRMEPMEHGISKKILY